MKAIVNDHVLAQSEDVIWCKDYLYFPRDAVRMECLEAAPKTAADTRCPHGVQFYDVMAGGARYPRAAWSYEAPQPSMKHVRGRIGFWNEVEVR
ncbi:MAG: DUF427 domain-containing protein [Variibacter sp.]|nr:DUF427 domain-containing protein [Variibacter sp.]